MKKHFISSLLLFFLISPVYAYTTQDELYSEEAMLNYGYSPDFVEMYNKVHARANGEPYDYQPQQQAIYKIQPFKTLKKLINYIEPASDDSQFMRHDIKPYPSWTDY